MIVLNELEESIAEDELGDELEEMNNKEDELISSICVEVEDSLQE